MADSCPPGFQFRNCSVPCRPGTFGRRCASKCSSTCLTPVCKPDTGACNRCKAGFRGTRCGLKCFQGTFGLNCSEKCYENCEGRLCNPFTGYCYKCVPGFSGTYCNTVYVSTLPPSEETTEVQNRSFLDSTDDEYVGAYVTLASVAVLFIGLLCSLFFYSLKRSMKTLKKKRRQSLKRMSGHSSTGNSVSTKGSKEVQSMTVDHFSIDDKTNKGLKTPTNRSAYYENKLFSNLPSNLKHVVFKDKSKPQRRQGQNRHEEEKVVDIEKSTGDGTSTSIASSSTTRRSALMLAMTSFVKKNILRIPVTSQETSTASATTSKTSRTSRVLDSTTQKSTVSTEATSAITSTTRTADSTTKKSATSAGDASIYVTEDKGDVYGKTTESLGPSSETHTQRAINFVSSLCYCQCDSMKLKEKISPAKSNTSKRLSDRIRDKKCMPTCCVPYYHNTETDDFDSIYVPSNGGNGGGTVGIDLMKASSRPKWKEFAIHEEVLSPPTQVSDTLMETTESVYFNPVTKQPKTNDRRANKHLTGEMRSVHDTIMTSDEEKSPLMFETQLKRGLGSQHERHSTKLKRNQKRFPEVCYISIEDSDDETISQDKRKEIHLRELSHQNHPHSPVRETNLKALDKLHVSEDSSQISRTKRDRCSITEPEIDNFQTNTGTDISTSSMNRNKTVLPTDNICYKHDPIQQHRKPSSVKEHDLSKASVKGELNDDPSSNHPLDLPKSRSNEKSSSGTSDLTVNKWQEMFLAFPVVKKQSEESDPNSVAPGNQRRKGGSPLRDFYKRGSVVTHRYGQGDSMNWKDAQKEKNKSLIQKQPSRLMNRGRRVKNIVHVLYQNFFQTRMSGINRYLHPYNIYLTRRPNKGPSELKVKEFLLFRQRRALKGMVPGIKKILPVKKNDSTQTHDMHNECTQTHAAKSEKVVSKHRKIQTAECKKPPSPKSIMPKTTTKRRAVQTKSFASAVLDVLLEDQMSEHGDESKSSSSRSIDASELASSDDPPESKPKSTSGTNQRTEAKPISPWADKVVRFSEIFQEKHHSVCYFSDDQGSWTDQDISSDQSNHAIEPDIAPNDAVSSSAFCEQQDAKLMSWHSCAQVCTQIGQSTLVEQRLVNSNLHLETSTHTIICEMPQTAGNLEGQIDNKICDTAITVGKLESVTEQNISEIPNNAGKSESPPDIKVSDIPNSAAKQESLTETKPAVKQESLTETKPAEILTEDGKLESPSANNSLEKQNDLEKLESLVGNKICEIQSKGVQTRPEEEISEEHSWSISFGSVSLSPYIPDIPDRVRIERSFTNALGGRKRYTSIHHTDDEVQRNLPSASAIFTDQKTSAEKEMSDDLEPNDTRYMNITGLSCSDVNPQEAQDNSFIKESPQSYPITPFRGLQHVADDNRELSMQFAPRPPRAETFPVISNVFPKPEPTKRFQENVGDHWPFYQGDIQSEYPQFWDQRQHYGPYVDQYGQLITTSNIAHAPGPTDGSVSPPQPFRQSEIFYSNSMGPNWHGPSGLDETSVLRKNVEHNGTEIYCRRELGYDYNHRGGTLPQNVDNMHMRDIPQHSNIPIGSYADDSMLPRDSCVDNRMYNSYSPEYQPQVPQNYDLRQRPPPNQAVPNQVVPGRLAYYPQQDPWVYSYYSPDGRGDLQYYAGDLPYYAGEQVHPAYLRNLPTNSPDYTNDQTFDAIAAFNNHPQVESSQLENCRYTGSRDPRKDSGHLFNPSRLVVVKEESSSSLSHASTFDNSFSATKGSSLKSSHAIQGTTGTTSTTLENTSKFDMLELLPEHSNCKGNTSSTRDKNDLNTDSSVNSKHIYSSEDNATTGLDNQTSVGQTISTECTTNTQSDPSIITKRVDCCDRHLATCNEYETAASQIRSSDYCSVIQDTQSPLEELSSDEEPFELPSSPLCRSPIKSELTQPCLPRPNDLANSPNKNRTGENKRQDSCSSTECVKASKPPRKSLLKKNTCGDLFDHNAAKLSEKQVCKDKLPNPKVKTKSLYKKMFRATKTPVENDKPLRLAPQGSDSKAIEKVKKKKTTDRKHRHPEKQPDGDITNQHFEPGKHISQPPSKEVRKDTIFNIGFSLSKSKNKTRRQKSGNTKPSEQKQEKNEVLQTANNESPRLWKQIIPTVTFRHDTNDDKDNKQDTCKVKTQYKMQKSSTCEMRNQPEDHTHKKQPKKQGHVASKASVGKVMARPPKGGCVSAKAGTRQRYAITDAATTGPEDEGAQFVSMLQTTSPPGLVSGCESSSSSSVATDTDFFDAQT